jgi:hypothetical protein
MDLSSLLSYSFGHVWAFVVVCVSGTTCVPKQTEMCVLQQHQIQALISASGEQAALATELYEFKKSEIQK